MDGILLLRRCGRQGIHRDVFRFLQPEKRIHLVQHRLGIFQEALKYEYAHLSWIKKLQVPGQLWSILRCKYITILEIVTRIPECVFNALDFFAISDFMIVVRYRPRSWTAQTDYQLDPWIMLANPSWRMERIKIRRACLTGQLPRLFFREEGFIVISPLGVLGIDREKMNLFLRDRNKLRTRTEGTVQRCCRAFHLPNNKEVRAFRILCRHAPPRSIAFHSQRPRPAEQNHGAASDASARTLCRPAAAHQTPAPCWKRPTRATRSTADSNAAERKQCRPLHTSKRSSMLLRETVPRGTPDANRRPNSPCDRDMPRGNPPLPACPPRPVRQSRPELHRTGGIHP